MWRRRRRLRCTTIATVADLRRDLNRYAEITYERETRTRSDLSRENYRNKMENKFALITTQRAGDGREVLTRVWNFHRLDNETKIIYLC